MSGSLFYTKHNIQFMVQDDYNYTMMWYIATSKKRYNRKQEDIQYIYVMCEFTLVNIQV